MSDGAVTYQGLKRLTHLPDRDARENGTVIAGQEYYDVEFIGGNISNVTLTDVTINGVTTARTERIVTADGDYTVVSDDYVITMDKVSDEATTIILPATPTTSRSLIIKDGKGDANTYNITLDPQGQTIDSGAAYAVDSSYGAVEIIYNGVEWNVIGLYDTSAAGAMVSGPGSSTNNALALWNGVGGDVIKDSNAIYNGTNLTLNGNAVYRAGGTDVPVVDGGTGVSTLTGYVKGAGTSPLTASATIPNTDITGLGTMSTQNANAVVITGGTIAGATVNTPNTGLSVRDTDNSHSLSIVPGSNLTANRTLTVTTGDADRTLTMAGNATISNTNTGDQTITLTGDVTGSGTGSFAATIANDAVTYAKMQNVTANSFIGRAAATDGDASAVTVAASQLAGRGSTGDLAAITLGPGLSISGTTLSPVFKNMYVSPQQVITSAGALTLAHGLGTTPTMVWCILTCTVANQGYNVGDRVFVPLGHQSSTVGTSISVVPDATNLNIRYGQFASAFIILVKNAGTVGSITNTSWTMEVRAAVVS